MKITPLEIRQKDFEKKLRGYDKDEVTAFLLSLSNEWERVLDENKELSIKLKHAEKEVSKLREVESSLYKTLKTAEDTGANLIDQSNKAAELHMKETQMKAEGLMSEAKSKAKAMMEKAEVEARQIIEELQEAVKNIEQNHRDIENHRHNAIAELKNLSVDLIEKVERTTKEQKEFRFDDYVKRVKELARESGERIKAENTDLEMPETPKIQDVDPEPEDEPPAPVLEEKKAKVEEPPEPMPKPASITPPVPEMEPQTEDVELEDVPENGGVAFVAEEQAEQNQEPVTEDSPEPVDDQEDTPADPEPDVVENPEPEEELELATEAVEEELPETGEEPEIEDELESAAEVVVEEEPEPEEEEEKPGPRISRTVSFFDEIDDND